VSGSMECNFAEGDVLTKIEVARTSLINGLLPQLRAQDRLSLVTFTECTQTIQPLAPVSQLDMPALKKTVGSLVARGGTSLQAGMQAVKEQLKLLPPNRDDQNENRVFYFTDMDPGTAAADCDRLFALTEELATQTSTFVTFVGLGVDFNSQVVERIGKIKGCSYLSVKNSRDFKKMMDEEFQFFVTLAAQDVKVTVDTDGWQVEEVFGSPGNEHPKEGVLCAASSVFPTPKPNPIETKGGVILVKVSPTRPDPPRSITTTTTYKDRYGKLYSESSRIDLPTNVGFGGSAVRKAVLLTRYVTFMKRLLEDTQKTKGVPTMSMESGLSGRVVVASAKSPSSPSSPPSPSSSRSPLDESYKPLVEKFVAYFAQEAEEVQDVELSELQKSLEEVRQKGFKKA